MPASEAVLRREWLQQAIRRASIMMLLVYVVRFFLNVTWFDYSDGSISMPLSLGVAYCGIIGSQKLNRDILSCFYICCFVSVCLYFVNSLINLREIILIKKEPNSTDNPHARSVYLYVTLGIETLLVSFQLFGGIWGKECKCNSVCCFLQSRCLTIYDCDPNEVVREHLLVNFGSRTQFPTTFSIEFVQTDGSQGQGQNGDPLDYEEAKKRTIASIPVKKYQARVQRPKSEENTSSVDQNSVEISISTSQHQPAEASQVTVEAVEVQERSNERIEEEEDEEEFCVICQDDLSEGDNIKVLPCKHFYHAVCVDAWLDRNLSCPMCMRPIPLLAEDGDRNSSSNPNQQEESNRGSRPMPDFVAVV